MDEVVYQVQPHLFQWERRKPPLLLFDSVLGTIVVTNHRVMFLSTGEGGFAGQFTVLGENIGMVFGETPASQLNLSALQNPGSLNLPLANVRSLETKRRWDFASYLTLHATTNAGQDLHYAFMSKFGLNPRELRRVSEAFATVKRQNPD